MSAEERPSQVPLRRRTWYVKARGRRWAVVRQGALAAESLQDTQDGAITRGLALAYRALGRLRVKSLGGRVEYEEQFTETPR